MNYAGNTNPPVLTVVWPQDGSSISGSQFTFQGTVDKPGAAITATMAAGFLAAAFRGRQIWSGAMMLRHFGEATAADAIERAIEDILATPEYRTPDVGGKATTQIVGKAIADALGK